MTMTAALPRISVSPAVASPEEISGRIRARREELRMSREDLAARTKLGYRTIVRLESPTNQSYPRADTTRRLAAALEINETELQRTPQARRAAQLDRIETDLAEVMRRLEIEAKVDQGFASVRAMLDEIKAQREDFDARERALEETVARPILEALQEIRERPDVSGRTRDEEASPPVAGGGDK